MYLLLPKAESWFLQQQCLDCHCQSHVSYFSHSCRSTLQNWCLPKDVSGEKSVKIRQIHNFLSYTFEWIIWWSDYKYLFVSSWDQTSTVRLEFFQRRFWNQKRMNNLLNWCNEEIMFVNATTTIRTGFKWTWFTRHKSQVFPRNLLTYIFLIIIRPCATVFGARISSKISSTKWIDTHSCWWFCWTIWLKANFSNKLIILRGKVQRRPSKMGI